MSTLNLQEQVSNLCIEGILRCLKATTTSGANYTSYYNPNNVNLEMLRFYWASSSGVEEIAKIVVYNPRRMTTTITFEENETDGEITGSVNAGATMLAQTRTLNPTLFVVLEPNTTYHSEPNHLVAWILSEAYYILLSSQRMYKKLNKFEWFNKKVSILERALRNQMLHEIMLTSSGRKRPSNSVLRSASKARLPIYQKAIEVYNLLDGIEEGQEEEIVSCLSQTLVADLEYWQQLELATALKAAYSLSDITGETIKLEFPLLPGQPVASVGKFYIYWQYPIPHRSREQLDISELWSRQILRNIGIKASDSRADIVILHENNIVSLFECKYFESTASLTQAVIEASSQIVRYARDSFPESTPLSKQLLTHSWIIVANRGSYSAIIDPESVSETFTNRFIYFTDINGLLNNSLRRWSIELVNRYSTVSVTFED